MLCPSCGYQITDPAATQCPNCGRALTPPPTFLGGGQPDITGPSAPSLSETTSTPAEPTQGPGASTPSAYPGYPGSAGATGESQMPPAAPPYGVPGYPSYPLPYGQPAPYSTPMQPYGQPAPYSTPMPPGYYATQAPPSGYPTYYPQGYTPYPPQLPPTPPKSQTGLIIGIVAAVLVVVIIVAVGGTLLLANGGKPTTGAPSATAARTATPSENLIFQDDFKSSSSGWSNDTHCFYASDGYHIPDGYSCFAPVEGFANADESADMMQTAGEIDWFYGLIVRRASAGNFYFFYIDSNGQWGFAKYVNETRTDVLPYASTTALHTGLNTSNTLKVLAKGTHFEFFINGTQVGQCDDATFAEGRWGVAGNSGGGVQVLVTKYSLALLN